MSWSFLLTSFVICVTPGIGALYTIAAGLTRGTRAGLLAAFACTLGTVPHAVAALTGLAAVLHASGVAFQAIKYAGVAYLLWMAWSTWRDTGVLDRLEGHAGGVQHGGETGERRDRMRDGPERAGERRQQARAGAAGQAGPHREERADAW